MILRVSDMDDFGRGISRELDKICFIEGGVLDDEVEGEIVLERSKYYLFKTNRVITKSSFRCEKKCLYEDVCGGCQLGGVNEDFEIDFKVNKFKNIMKKFAGISLDNVIIDKSFREYYRNKITLVCRDGILGLKKNKSDILVPIKSCLIVRSKINNIIDKLMPIVKGDSGINSIVIKMGNETEEILLSIYGRVRDYTKFLDLSDVLVINDRVVSERKYITSYILDKKFLLSNSSFFQINYDITNKMYSYIREMIKDVGGVNVLDLYCGVGSIAITISSCVNYVFGIEIVDEAIHMAKLNKKINSISNVDFKAGDVSCLINDVEGNFDTYIIDPPRSGISQVLIDNILSKLPKNIIYVSCNPITFARDVKLLEDKYVISSVRLFNMFPRTYHVECVCVLNLRKPL